MAIKMIYSIPYLFFFILEFIFVNNISNSNSVLKKYNLFINYLVFIIFSIIFFGLRGFINTDTIGYYPFFERSPTLFSTTNELIFFLSKGDYARWGKGFLLYTIIIKSITSNYMLWQLITFIIQFVLIFNFLKTYLSEYKWWGLLFFYIFGFFTIMLNLYRNCFSIIAFLYSIKFIVNRKLFRFLVLIFIGSTFHTTAYLFLPFYFFHRRFSNKSILILFCLGNMIYLLQISWIHNIARAISSINTNWYILFEFYSKSEVFSAAYGITIGYIERFITFVLVYIFSSKLIKKDRKNIIFINFTYIYLFIYLFMSEMNILVSRVPLLFIFTYWIIYPQIYGLLQKRDRATFLFFIFLYGFLKVAFSTNSVMFSYNSILDGMSYEKYLHIYNLYQKSLLF